MNLNSLLHGDLDGVDYMLDVELSREPLEKQVEFLASALINVIRHVRKLEKREFGE